MRSHDGGAPLPSAVTDWPCPLPAWPARDADHLLVSGAQMAALEEQLFASGLPVEALMEKAALAISRRLLGAPPDASGIPEAEDLAAGVVVLVGPGHNGGDGLVVARELHLAGVPVRLWCPFERRKPLTERHWSHARWLGIPVLETPPDPGDPNLWIDALFGHGQSRPPGEAIESLLRERDQAGAGPLLAVDVPTGLCGDSGRVLGRQAARAARTLCVGLWKRGLVQDAALPWVGRLERVELGFPPALLATLPADQPLGLGGPGGGRWDATRAPRPRLDPAASKYARGRLLVIAGSAAYRGAAHLALAGATASGAGSLRAVVPAAVADQLWMVLPHVVLEPRPLAEGGLERLDAVLVGPGLGPVPEGTAGEREPWWDALRRFTGLVVVDAEGLRRISPGWLRERAGPTWITPHAGEFAGLCPELAALPPLEAAAEAARLCQATVLLKGARSVIAAADGRRWQLLEACGAAARAGLGDGLAGYAAGLGARMLASLASEGRGGAQVHAPDASWLALAALDHAEAGCRATRELGPGGATPLAVTTLLAQAPLPPCAGPATVAIATQRGSGQRREWALKLADGSR
ncbi:MAG: NAD(P)H-hydrate epimerase [Cyanobacteriota bacterium]|nr:NAD(P)H-hydrate epimerase [Cyanobacteriota bacterium]